jgi:hypothetical protein
MDNHGLRGVQSLTNLTPNHGTIGSAKTRPAMTLEWFADVALVKQMVQTHEFSQYFPRGCGRLMLHYTGREEQTGVQRTNILPSERFVASSFDNEEGAYARRLVPERFLQALLSRENTTSIHRSK